MTTALDRATAALGNANVKAFLRVIREGESNQSDDAYRMLFGGELVTVPPWVHPFYGRTTTEVGHSTAFGAYQFLGTSFKEATDALGLGNDASPINQDLCAVWTIDAKRHALTEVESGNLVAACSKLADEWVSLAGLRLDRVQRVFQQFGGTPGAAQEPPPGPAPLPGAPAIPQPEHAAMPFALAGILQLIPELIGLFAKGDRGQTNAKAAQVVVDAFTQAVPGASGPGDALDKAASDPTVAAAAKAAVLANPAVVALTEVGGGVAAARIFDLQQQAMVKPFYQTSAVFWVSVLLLPLVYWFVGSMIIGGYGQILDASGVDLPSWAHTMLAIFGGSWTGESRAGGFNLVIGLVLGGICGVYFGVSVTQQRQQTTGQ